MCLSNGPLWSAGIKHNDAALRHIRWRLVDSKPVAVIIGFGESTITGDEGPVKEEERDDLEHILDSFAPSRQ